MPEGFLRNEEKNTTVIASAAARPTARCSAEMRFLSTSEKETRSPAVFAISRAST